MNPIPLTGLFVLPSAGVAVSVAGAIALAWLVWILADPHASGAVDLVLQDLGLQSTPKVPADWIKDIHRKARWRSLLSFSCALWKSDRS